MLIEVRNTWVRIDVAVGLMTLVVFFVVLFIGDWIIPFGDLAREPDPPTSWTLSVVLAPLWFWFAENLWVRRRGDEVLIRRAAVDDRVPRLRFSRDSIDGVSVHVATDGSAAVIRLWVGSTSFDLLMGRRTGRIQELGSSLASFLACPCVVRTGWEADQPFWNHQGDDSHA